MLLWQAEGDTAWVAYERQRKANAREQKALAEEKLARLEGRQTAKTPKTPQTGLGKAATFRLVKDKHGKMIEANLENGIKTEVALPRPPWFEVSLIIAHMSIYGNDH